MCHGCKRGRAAPRRGQHVLHFHMPNTTGTDNYQCCIEVMEWRRYTIILVSCPDHMEANYNIDNRTTIWLTSVGLTQATVLVWPTYVTTECREKWEGLYEQAFRLQILAWQRLTFRNSCVHSMCNDTSGLLFGRTCTCVTVACWLNCVVRWQFLHCTCVFSLTRVHKNGRLE